MIEQVFPWVPWKNCDQTDFPWKAGNELSPYLVFSCFFPLLFVEQIRRQFIPRYLTSPMQDHQKKVMIIILFS